MPGNIQSAAPSGVMPYGLCTAFVESRELLQLQATYHDGTTHRSRLAATSRRTFKLSRRLAAANLATLQAFWAAHQASPFYFYNFAEGPYDGTGAATAGRYAVVFRCNWSQTTGLLRSDVQQLELIEVA
jgi:hypothetical protein